MRRWTSRRESSSRSRRRTWMTTWKSTEERFPLKEWTLESTPTTTTNTLRTGKQVSFPFQPNSCLRPIFHHRLPLAVTEITVMVIPRTWAEPAGRPDRPAGRARTHGSCRFRCRQPSSSQTGRHHRHILIKTLFIVVEPLLSVHKIRFVEKSCKVAICQNGR